MNVPVATVTGNTFKEDNLENIEGIPGGSCLHYLG